MFQVDEWRWWCRFQLLFFWNTPIDNRSSSFEHPFINCIACRINVSSLYFNATPVLGQTTKLAVQYLWVGRFSKFWLWMKALYSLRFLVSVLAFSFSSNKRAKICLTSWIYSLVILAALVLRIDLRVGSYDVDAGLAHHFKSSRERCSISPSSYFYRNFLLNGV